MTSWRPRRRKATRASQPFLPGLLSGNDPERASEAPSRRLSSPGEAALHQARSRLPFLFLSFLLLFVTISGRVVFLSAGEDVRDMPPLRAAVAPTPPTSRADILDRNGSLLATSLPTIRLVADTRKILDAQEATAKILSVLPDLDAKKLAKELTTPQRHIIVHRHLTPRQYYALNKLGIAGIDFAPDESRVYPTGAITSHVLGYTDIDNTGISGLEKSLDKRLSTEPSPVTTTLDIRVQTILHRELQNALNTFKALGAAGIVMDIRNGEVLALVSLPDFNPQNPGTARPEGLFNNATLGVYEMGSTFKIFNTALALDSGIINIAERFDTIRPIEIGGRTIRDFHPADHWLNVPEIFVDSSNIGSARIASRIGAEKQRAFLKTVGLLERPSFEVPEIGSPLVPSQARWGETATMTISFGHGIAVSPLQMVAAAASLINDGIKITPTLLKDRAEDPQDKERLIKAQTSAQLRALLRLVVKYGTAQKADSPGYLVGGKTGTADKSLGEKYSETARVSSFIGVFPVNAPRYIVFALLDDPKGTANTHGFATAGWTAAPIVGKVVGQIGPLLNLEPIEPDIVETAEKRLVRSLGGSVSEIVKRTTEINDYASFESYHAR